MRNALKMGLVSLMAIGAAAPAFAQYPPTPQYERDQQDYQQDRADYAARNAAYQDARREYERRLADYQVERDRYDRRYGVGAYARAYGPEPAWDSARWDNDRYDGPRDPRYYGRDTSYRDPCRDRGNSNATAGGIIGALAGAALGSNVAARNARTEGAVLGAVVGGVAGASIGKASAKCDDRGYYFSYNETVPYRESRYDRYRRSGQYDYSYYSRQRCRLAAAPIDWDDNRGRDVRYVRVCPDGTGRYRITG